MNSNPLISVIIPVYNAQDYLEQCVESIINQSYKNLEIILINDGSTDASGKICDEYKLNDLRVNVLHIENQGVSNARNVGISYAKGQYVMFVDSDDWLHPKAIEKSLNLIQMNDSDIVFFSWEKVFYDRYVKENYLIQHGKILSESDCQILRRRCIGLIDKELFDPVKTDIFNTPWAKLYKLDLIRSNNIHFIERKKVGMEDVLFNIHIFQYCNKIDLLPEYLYYYRQDNQTSLSKKDTFVLDEKFRNLFSAIQEIPLNQMQLKALENRKAVSIINIFMSFCSSSVGIGQQVRNIRKVLTAEDYGNAVSGLNIKYMPIYWKVFFVFAKNHQALLLLFYIKFAIFIRNVRNRRIL